MVNQQLGWSVAVEDGLVAAGAPKRADGAIYTYSLSHSLDSTDLQLAITADRNAVGVGESVTLTLMVTNPSLTVPATAIVITGVLPAEFEFVDASDTCVREAGSVTCRIDLVPSGESQSVTITATATQQATVTSRAWVSARQHDPDPSNNEANVVTLIEAAPPPRIVLREPLDGAVVAVFPHDVHQLRFDVENWSLEPPGGRHVHWTLNDEPQPELFDDRVDISGLDAGEHTVTLVLADADHAEVGEAVTTRFTIERPPWPSVIITAPKNAEQFDEDSSIQVRYELDYDGVATGPQDFQVTLNGNAPMPLQSNASLLLEDLPVGEHTVEISYRESGGVDAAVTFVVRASEEPIVTDDVSSAERSGGGSGGGGGSLGWPVAMLFVSLILMNVFRVVSRRR